MSYEGYEMYLCANGHYMIEGARYMWDDEPQVCEICEAPIIWFCSVDQTNDGGVAPVLIEHEPEKTETCRCCGHTKVVEEARFCIPSNAGHLQVEKEAVNLPQVEVQFRDNDSGELFPTADEAWKNKGYHL